MSSPLPVTSPIQPVRRKNWLKTGPVLLASVVLHALVLLLLSLLGSYGFFGNGSPGDGGNGGDTFSVTWIPGGGSGGGRKFDTALLDSGDDGPPNQSITLENRPEESKKGPLLTVTPKDPDDVFRSETNEPLMVNSDETPVPPTRIKPKNRIPVPTDPNETEVTTANNPRTVAPASARTTVPMESASNVGSGDGPGGGRGEGQGTGQGNGQGDGNAAAGKGKGGVSFFGITSKAKKIVYVIDASESMRHHNAIELARENLWNSLQGLPPESQFQVIFFNLTVHTMSRPGTKVKLFPATEENLRLARQWITGIQPDSGTDRLAALKQGLSFDPDVIYLLTDADDPVMTPKQLLEIQRGNKRKTQIHVVEFGQRADLSGDNFLKKLARENGGKHFYNDLIKSEP